MIHSLTALIFGALNLFKVRIILFTLSFLLKTPSRFVAGRAFADLQQRSSTSQLLSLRISPCMILVFNGAIMKRDGSTRNVDLFQPMTDERLGI